MIDEIFAMIMKEARERPGKDLVPKIYTVYTEISGRILAVLDHLRQEERREKENERQTGNTRGDPSATA